MEATVQTALSWRDRKPNRDLLVALDDWANVDEESMAYHVRSIVAEIDGN